MGHLPLAAKRDYDCCRKENASLKAAKFLPLIIRGERKVDDEADYKGHHKWTVRELREVEKLFKTNIKDRKISMDIVKHPVNESSCLKSLSPVQVPDKLRSLFSKDAESSESGNKTPPEEEENATNKVIQFLQNSDTNEPSGKNKPSNEDEASDAEKPGHSDGEASFILFTMSSNKLKSQNKLFTDSEKEAIRRLFTDMIKGRASI